MTEGIISDLFSNSDTLIGNAKKLIKRIYLSDDKPWIVGYSGGKDSTVLVQLVFESLKELSSEELHKSVYIISSDTLVETPLIIQSINQTLRRINDEALLKELPIETHKVKPMVEQSFWVNIIGKGYPSPNQQFRWCTDRMKIDPANRFITKTVDSFGEVIMLLGVREDESATRANVIRSHTVAGKDLMRHSSLPNAYVFAPIKNFTTDNVWDYLLHNPSPWGDDNHELHHLYQDSNSGECPLVVDTSIKESAGSCGNSRFGCWVCTVVNEDKALSGFIRSGHDWMKPLRDFRNWLTSIRDERHRRMKYRMNGQVYYKEVKIEEVDGQLYVLVPKKGNRPKQHIHINEYKQVKRENLKDYIEENNIDLSAPVDDKLLIELENDKYAQLGLGPFTLETRREILEKLLHVQKDLSHPSDPNYVLIREEELKEIRRIWYKNIDWQDYAPQIFRDVMGHDLEWEFDDRAPFDKDQVSDLELLSDQYHIDIKVLKKLVSIEKNYSGYKVRRGLMDEIGKVLKQDYLHL